MNLTLIKKNKKNLLSKSQSTFNNLIKKIEKLQKSIQTTEIELNNGLQYYHSYIHPTNQKIVDSLSKCIPIFYSYYRHPKSKLSEDECNILQELIRSLLQRLSHLVTPQKLSEEIKTIIEDIEGIGFQKILDEEFQLHKDALHEFATQNGLNIDLSDLNAMDSKEELQEKIQKALLEANSTEEEEEVVKTKANKKTKTKTAQQLQKEQKAKEIEELQKKGLSKIYKDLAKIFHPDLELDASLKAEKEDLMKQLTTAYENQDLHTLLALEVTWMNRLATTEEGSYFQAAEDQLAIYNSILKDQVSSLKDELSSLSFRPQYYEMSHILRNTYCRSIIEALENEHEQLTCDIERYSSAIADLNGGSNFKRLKQILKEFSHDPIDDIIRQIFDC